MEAGRAVDCAIAERVFGWKVQRAATPQPGFDVTMLVWAPGQEGDAPMRYSWCDDIPMTGDSLPKHAPGVPYYSTSIAAAWTVAEVLSNRHDNFTLYRAADGTWVVAWDEPWPSHPERALLCDIARADTAPLAIVRAALAAVAGSAPTR